MRVLFLGSPEEVVPVLDFLRKDASFMSAHKIVGIVSQPARPTGRGGKLTDPPVAVYAKANAIPLLQPETVKDPEFIAAMKALAPDLAITAAFGQILTSEFLAIPSRGTINIHPSLLPKYRGAVPVPAALLAGDSTTGVTVLFTVRKLDAGNIISQETIAIEPSETADVLLKRLFCVGAAMIVPALTKLADIAFIGTAQDETKATHCRKIEKDDGNVEWSQPGLAILNSYRAYEPWPGTFTYLGEKRLSLTTLSLAAELDQPQHSPASPGAILFDKKMKALLVGTGDNQIIAITGIRPAGGKTMDASGFWNGLKVRENLTFRREALS